MTGTGICLAWHIPLVLTSCAALICICSAIILRYIGSKFPAGLTLGALFIHAGWLFLACAVTTVHPGTRHKWHAPEAESLTVRGVVITDPDIRPCSRGYLVQFSLLADSCGVNDLSPVDHKGWLRVNLYGPGGMRRPSYGERWQCTGKTTAPGYGGVSYLNVQGRGAVFLSGGHGWSFKKHIYAARHAASSCLSLGIGEYEESSAILQAIMLGYRGRLSHEARGLFIATGTLHIFAISGLHVGMIAVFTTFFLRLIRVSRIHWVLFIAPLLVVYTVATGARPSAVRACIMTIIYFLAPLLGRKTDHASGLAAAAALILLWDPSQLLDVGFIYSFAVVAGIVLLYPPLSLLFPSLSRHDPLSEHSAGTWFVMMRHLSGVAVVSAAAWLASAPLTAWYFGRFTPVALLSNVVVIPTALAIVFTGCLCLLLGPCASFLAVMLNYVNVVLISTLTTVIRGLAAIPGMSLKIDRPSIWLVLGWYLILIVVGIVGIRKARRFMVTDTPE